MFCITQYTIDFCLNNHMSVDNSHEYRVYMASYFHNFTAVTTTILILIIIIVIWNLLP
jgi:hypothetical protein